jgi:hypothetical protein
LNVLWPELTLNVQFSFRLHQYNTISGTVNTPKPICTWKVTLPVSSGHEVLVCIVGGAMRYMSGSGIRAAIREGYTEAKVSGCVLRTIHTRFGARAFNLPESCLQ